MTLLLVRTGSRIRWTETDRHGVTRRPYGAVSMVIRDENGDAKLILAHPHGINSEVAIAAPFDGVEVVRW